MSINITSRNPVRQPQRPPIFNWGLIGSDAIIYDANRFKTLLTSTKVFDGTEYYGAISPNLEGMGRKWTSNNGGVDFGTDSYIPCSGEVGITVLFVGTPISDSGNRPYVFAQNNTGSTKFIGLALNRETTSTIIPGAMSLLAQNSTGGCFLYAGSQFDGGCHSWVVSRNTSSGVIIKDGIVQSSTLIDYSSFAGDFYDASTQFNIGQFPPTTSNVRQNSYGTNLVIMWPRVLPLDLSQSLSKNPYQVYKPIKRVFYLGSPNAYTLTGSAGTFTLTGQSASLLSDKLLTSNAGTFTLTGQDAGLLAGRVLTSDSGNFTLSGQDAALLSGRILTGATGTFTLSGQDATLTYTPNANAYVLTCDAGSFVFTGQDAGLITDRVLSGEAASFTLLGQDASLLAGRMLTAEQAAFTLTGQDALLVANRVLTADAGSFSLSGQDATLLYTPVGSYILTADSGAFSVTGQSANLLYNRVLSGEAGSFTVTGIDASLLRGLSLPAEAGSFLLSGQDATLTYTHGYILTCETGSYALSGQDASLLVDRILSAGTGGFTLTGNSANLTAGAVNNGVVGDDNWLICIKGSSNKVLIKGMENTSIIKGFDNDITIH